MICGMRGVDFDVSIIQMPLGHPIMFASSDKQDKYLHLQSQ